MIGMLSLIIACTVLMRQFRTFYHLTCIATYVMFISIVRNPRDRKELSYLGVASGFFARLSLNAEVPFEEVTELYKMATEAVKSVTQKDTSA